MWHKNVGPSPGADAQPPKRPRYAGKNPMPPQNPRDKRAEEAKKFLKTHPASMPGQSQGLSRDIDKRSYENVVPEAGAVLPHNALSQQILVYHESEPAESGNDWMYKLKEESMQFLADQKGVELHKLQRDSVYKKGIESLIDKIFSLLQRYTYEFNQIAAGTDLHVSGSIAGEVTEVMRYNKLREAEETQTFFRARLTTRHFSLNLRGSGDSVDFFLVPANKAMALSKTEVDYRPLSSIQVRITDSGMMWRMENGVPAVESLEELCMWLFSNLINETKHAATRFERNE
ncbi:MAG TPA: hypothetical protein V6C97_30555 [Oculatellaceae cyanobacterium]